MPPGARGFDFETWRLPVSVRQGPQLAEGEMRTKAGIRDRRLYRPRRVPERVRRLARWCVSSRATDVCRESRNRVFGDLTAGTACSVKTTGTGPCPVCEPAHRLRRQRRTLGQADACG